MPHCVLEFSANVVDQVNFPEFFSKLHDLLSESGHIDKARLKGRWVRHENYFVGDGTARNAFVYLQISLLSGRPLEVRQALGKRAFELLQQYFPRSQRELNCSVTLEMREMQDEAHFKISKAVES